MIVYGFLKVHGELLLLSFSHRAEREVRQEKKKKSSRSPALQRVAGFAVRFLTLRRL